MEDITSRSNPKVKQARALQERKARQESGLFLVEGLRHLGEAVEAGAQIEQVFYSQELLRTPFASRLVAGLIDSGVACASVSAGVIESLAEKDNPQGVIAVVRQPSLRLADLHPDTFTWGVALVDPADPGNLGSVLRSVDAVGASGVLLLSSSAGGGGLVDAYHPSSVRASMGAIFWRIVVRASFEEFTAWAARFGYHIYGTSARADQDYRYLEHYRFPAILLLGSEREGLTPVQAAACEVLLRLPMHGHATSLNLAVAAGVLLYDMLAKM
jgi:TrmH family RNA methyltransferase